MSINDKHLRQARLLMNLASYLKAHDGVRLADLARTFSMPPHEMRKVLMEELMVTGVPPYTPADYISVFFEADGESDDPCVHLHQHDELRQAVRLTAAEALALKTVLSVYRTSSSDDENRALDSLKSKLAEAMPFAGEASDVEGAEAVAVTAPSERLKTMLQQIRHALSNRCKLSVEYFSPATGETSERLLWPIELYERGARLYLHAWCESRADRRNFRMDRMRSCEATRQRVPDSAETQLDGESARAPSSLQSKRRLVVRFDPSIATDVHDEWSDAAIDATSHEDGSLTLALPLLSETWAFGWVLSFGPAAELLEPSELRPRFAERLRRLIAAL